MVAISSPSDSDGSEYGTKIPLAGEVHNAEDPSSALRVWWESDLDGELPLDAETDLLVGDDGLVSSYYDALSVGTHALRLWCGDTTGRSNFTEVMVDVWGPPTADIVDPTDGDVFEEGDLISFRAMVSDAHDDPSALQLEWSSSIDGVLNTGAADDNGSATFTAVLSPGDHEILLTVVDSHDMNETNMITVHVTANGDDE